MPGKLVVECSAIKAVKEGLPRAANENSAFSLGCTMFTVALLRSLRTLQVR